jgi:hypothetical protein
MVRTLISFLVLVGVSFAQNFANFDPPHYIKELGLEKCAPTKDLIELRKLEKFYLSQTRQIWNETFSTWPNDVGEGMWNSRILYGKQFKIYFRDYQKINNKIYYKTARGVKEVSEKDLEDFSDFIVQYLKDGVDNLYKVYSNFVPIKDFEKYNKEINDSQLGTVTLRDLMFLPYILDKSDFVPNEIYITPMEPWGMVYLSFYRGGVSRVFLNPEAMFYDCLYGKPTVVQHELSHNQNSLQWLPLGSYVDFEIMAELASGVWNSDYYWELLHPYLLPLNDLIHAFFGFDYMNSGTVFDFKAEPAGIRWTNEARIKEYQEQWEKMKEYLTDWVRKFFTDFYEDPLFAVSTNMNLCWDNAFLSLSFSSQFELAGLSGFENTQKWLSANEKLIEDTWERAKQDVGNSIESDKKPSDNSFQSFRNRRDFCPQPYTFTANKSKTLQELNKVVQEDYKTYGKEVVFNNILNGKYDGFLKKIKEEVFNGLKVDSYKERK